MAYFLDVCRFTPTAGGTSDFTYSSAVIGYQSPSAAGVVNGRVYKYRAESSDLSQWEVGEGAYNTGTGVLARTTILYNSSGTTSAINFSAAPQVAIVALTPDLISIDQTPPCVPGGRLTLTTATPVTTTDLSAQTTIYYTPSGKGSLYVPIYDGTRLVNTSIGSELSLALDATSGHTGYHQSGKNFDLFVFSDSGTIRLGSSPAWTNDTTRADVLTTLNGVTVNNASITLRFGSSSGNTVSVAANKATWVGMFRASSDGQTDDSRTKRFLWNAYNQKNRVLRRLGSSTYTDTGGGGWLVWLNSSTFRVEFVRGDDNDPVFLRFDGLHSVSSTGTAQVGIDLDGTSTNDADLNIASNSSSSILTVAAAVFNQHVSAGYHYLQLMEKPGASNTTFYGELSGLQYGAVGNIRG